MLPTDTVYGIGADAFTPRAVKALLDAKGRGRQMPPPVLIPDVRTLDGLATEVPGTVRALAAAFWPGALTLIVTAQPTLTWDLGEENDNTFDQRKEFADFIHALDPWEHPVTVHPHIGGLDHAFGELFGTHLEQAVIQGFPETAAGETLQLVQDSIGAGRPWAVMHVEQAPADEGALPDAVDFDHDTIRKQVLWGNLMSRGSGVEWYFGYGYPNDVLARLHAAGARAVDVPVRPVYGPAWKSGIKLSTVFYPVLFVLARAWARRLATEWSGAPTPLLGDGSAPERTE